MTFCSVIILRVRLTCVIPLSVLVEPLKGKETVRSYFRHYCSDPCVLDETEVKVSRVRMLKD